MFVTEKLGHQTPGFTNTDTDNLQGLSVNFLIMGFRLCVNVMEKADLCQKVQSTFMSLPCFTFIDNKTNAIPSIVDLQILHAMFMFLFLRLEAQRSKSTYSWKICSHKFFPIITFSLSDFD